MYVRIEPDKYAKVSVNEIDKQYIEVVVGDCRLWITKDQADDLFYLLSKVCEV